MEYKILIIDDDEADFESAERTLLKEAATMNHTIITDHALTLSQGIEVISHNEYDALLLDLNLPDTVELSGLEDFTLRTSVIVNCGTTASFN